MKTLISVIAMSLTLSLALGACAQESQTEKKSSQATTGMEGACPCGKEKCDCPAKGDPSKPCPCKAGGKDCACGDAACTMGADGKPCPCAKGGMGECAGAGMGECGCAGMGAGAGMDEATGMGECDGMGGCGDMGGCGGGAPPAAMADHECGGH